MAAVSVKDTLPTAEGANVGPPRTYPGLGAGSLYCCPSCKAWSKDCGVGFCRNESLIARAERRAVRAEAFRYQKFMQALHSKRRISQTASGSQVSPAPLLGDVPA